MIYESFQEQKIIVVLSYSARLLTTVGEQTILKCCWG